MLGITNICKYPKLRKVTNFCSNQSDLFSGYFVYFFWLNVVKCFSNEILNSWRKERLFTSIKLNEQYEKWLRKLTFFSRFAHFLKVTPLTILLFILLLEMCHFSSKMSLKEIMDKIMITPLHPLRLNFFIEYIVQSDFVQF